MPALPSSVRLRVDSLSVLDRYENHYYYMHMLFFGVKIEQNPNDAVTIQVRPRSAPCAPCGHRR